MTTPPRPDPARGVFETLLVLGGRPVELDAHLTRAATSLAAIFDAELPSSAEKLVHKRAIGLPLGRLRLTVAPTRDGLACDAVAAPVDPAIVFPGWDRGAELHGLPCPGGLGPHKLVDRPGLPEGAGAAVPLLLEQDGEVLEAGRANIFAVREGTLVTPGADGRILAGITRAAVLEIARQEDLAVEERPLQLDELFDADEVFLTGSVRGIEPARSLDGTGLPASGRVGALIAAGLRQRYGTSRTAPAEASRRA
ncbi:MAG TPA: aminotransferase class IV [Solirubrobacterales bacterium]|nr:aminotransferase class IV [Solirubrobacterales bacterium]